MIIIRLVTDNSVTTRLCHFDSSKEYFRKQNCYSIHLWIVFSLVYRFSQGYRFQMTENGIYLFYKQFTLKLSPTAKKCAVNYIYYVGEELSLNNVPVCPHNVIGSFRLMSLTAVYFKIQFCIQFYCIQVLLYIYILHCRAYLFS